MAPEKDIYTEMWEKRNAAKEEAEKNAILQKQEIELKKISTNFDFFTDEKNNYILKIDEKVIDMKFKSFEALKDAANAIGRALRFYETKYGNESKKPKFYGKHGKLFIDDGMFFDTESMDEDSTRLFLKRSDPWSLEGRAEVQRLANILNDIVGATD
ncbi:hypothetical protein BKN14_03580 [Candidatus Gracilibacteria bacterium HOT-871]|nr:hypothetical protein BKN14_03580 [Candidatus Gracilibacteria bacterium HOT-871]